VQRWARRARAPAGGPAARHPRGLAMSSHLMREAMIEFIRGNQRSRDEQPLDESFGRASWRACGSLRSRELCSPRHIPDIVVHWQSIGGSTGNLAYCIAWGTAARRRGRGKPDLNEFQVRDCEFDV
jgi:hypothetical protein